MSAIRQTRRWTSEEVDYLKENFGKIPDSDIATKLNRTELACVRKAYNLNIIKGRYLSDEQDDYLWEHPNMSNKQLAKRFGMTERAIRKARYNRGVGTIIEGNFDKVTCAEAGRLTGKHKSTISKCWIKHGGLRNTRVGKYNMIRIKDLLEFMRKHPEQWDATKCDKDYFGQYEWFREKRKADFEKMVNKRWEGFI